MHGPTCIFWANLTPFSLELAPEIQEGANGPAGGEIGTKCRGIYCTLPADAAVRPRGASAPSCHNDGHPMSLGLV